MLENGRFDARYLANANKAAAKADNEPTWTQASWLVKINDGGNPGLFLRGTDLGFPTEKRPRKDGEWDFDSFVALQGGQIAVFDPNDEAQAVEGDLFVDTELNGIRCKSVLQIYREAAMRLSLAQWAGITGVSEQDIAELAREFTSHGKRAVADLHRGVSQLTSGFYNVVVWMMVNVLVGNHDWEGGLAKATTWNIAGDKAGMPFNLTGGRDKIAPWGISIIRHNVDYAKTTLFEGYPAKRVWYPFASDIYQEVIPSAGDMYPYQLKWLFMYMGTPVYSLPAGHALAKVLADPGKIPLFICSDITVGETSMYADYIFPDLTYLERWEFSGSHPSVTPKVAPFRQPAAAPLTETVTVFGQQTPISLESTLLAMAERLGLPGFGQDAFGPGLHLMRDEAMYLRMVANIAHGEKPDGSELVPAASEEEIELFARARRHLPSSVFDVQRWKAVIGDNLWPHAVYVMNRGGRFQNYLQAYKDGQMVNKYGKMVGLYFENLVKIRNSMTGEPYLPHGDYVRTPLDCSGQPIEDAAAGFDLTLITYKAIAHTKSRTVGNYWLQAVYPENSVEISVADSRRLGLVEGDLVKVISPTNSEGVWDFANGTVKPMVGRIRVTEGLRPGVAAFSLGHGHWAYGASGISIDDVEINADRRRATGIHANAAMRLDPVLGNTGLVDVVGASAVFYQSQVKLVKA